jgi:hypothetical protein
MRMVRLEFLFLFFGFMSAFNENVTARCGQDCHHGRRLSACLLAR